MSESKKVYDLFKDARNLLKLPSLHELVQIPERENANEWIAVHTQDFFNQVNIIHLIIAEFCTESSCPIMSAGPKYEFLWNSETTKKPEKLSAPKHIEALLMWAHKILDDTKIFPALMENATFPENFLDLIKPIYKKLFRVYCHIYYHHFHQVSALGAEGHLNTCFLHFFYFIEEHQLVIEKELRPLKKLADSLKKAEANQLERLKLREKGKSDDNNSDTEETN